MSLFRKDRMRPARLPRPLKIIVIVYLAYLALVLLVATPLLNVFAPKIYREQTGRELQVGKIIWLNPFTLALNARDVGSANPDGSRFWSFTSLDINLSLASLWRGHLALDALALRGLYLQIDQTAPGRFNFSDILDYRAKHFATAATTAAKTGQKPAAPFAIDIGHLVLSATHLGYRAPYASEPIAVTLADTGFTLNNFSTLPPKKASDSKTSSAAPQAAGKLPALRGTDIALTLQSLTADFLRKQRPFTLRLHNLSLASPALSTRSSIAQHYTFGVLDAGGGSARIKGDVTFAAQRTAGTLQMQAVDLVPVWQYLANRLAFTARSAQLGGTVDYRLDWGTPFTYRVQNSQLALRNVQLQANGDADTKVAFAALHVDGIAVDSAQSQLDIGHVALDKPALRGWNRGTNVSLLDMFSVAGSGKSTGTPSPWHVRIDAVDVDGGSAHWRASQLGSREFTAAPIALHVANVRWPDAQPAQLHATATVGSTPKAARDMTLAVDGTLIPSTVTGKVDATIANLPLTWGNPLLENTLRATIARGALNTKLAFRFEHAQPTRVQSEGDIDRFELRAQTDKRKLATWKKLRWQRLVLEPAQHRLDIRRVVLTQPWVQFRIAKNGITNLQQLVKKSGAPVVKKPGSSAKAATTASHRTPPAGKPWHFALHRIHVDRGAIDFRDASVTSTFHTNIGSLSGNIDGLETPGAGKHSPAKVGLHGNVDGYAPVALTGTVDPFAARPALDVALDMTNLDLATLTPYSSTYAGYRIDSGRLTVQLAYTLQNGRIKGKNHIVVDQMKLGRQVRGPKVLDLPLRFAIYLLTDANGVLDLGVDVTGDVNDPDFSVGGIIWKAFRNLIVKTATSPFRALGHLVGAAGGEDLSRVEFAAGSDAVDAAQRKKLQTLDKALKEKSKLKLGITGHISPSQDILALRDEKLSRTLIARSGITRADIHEQSKRWQRAVVELFKKRFPKEDPAHWQVMQMNDAMRDNEELDPGALQQLAAKRALAVKQVLVTDFGLAPDRAYIKPVDLGADKQPGLQVTMQVEQ